MLIVKSINQVPIRLTEERWNHIRYRHSEMECLRESILETLSEPEVIHNKVIMGSCSLFAFIPRPP
jgi:hypothetical protein